MKRRLVSGYTNDGMGATLTRIPIELPQVNALRVAVLGTNAVGRLGDGMSMQRHGVGVLDENIERSIVRIPGVLHLNGEWRWWHVEQVLESSWYLKLRAELGVVVIEVVRCPWRRQR